MAFVDEARVSVKAGDGGKGCESFHQDKYDRHPRPDGGNGGKGGDIILIADPRIQTLLDYRFKQHYKAERGGHGGSRGKKGRTGEDCHLKVPVGTIIRDDETGMLLKDLVEAGQSVAVAKGGEGGIGNANKKIPAPPKSGVERRIHLELKIIADVGLVGFPNAGKSTLISAVSKVKSKIASYPFTTKQPVLGIVQDEDGEGDDFVVADLPGLIEGAHSGRGLGDKFLKHAERTKILVHVVDMAAEEGRDPIEDYRQIQHELESYSDDLNFKSKIIVANKMDLPSAEENLIRFQKDIKDEIIPVSALEKEGLNTLIDQIRSVLCQENSREKSNES